MTRSGAAVAMRAHHTSKPPRPTKAGVVEIGLRVLLVDAELDRLLPVADALHRAGVAVDVATSVDEALVDIAASRPDVVVAVGEMERRLAPLLESAGITHVGGPLEARVLLKLLRARGLRYP